MAVAVAAGAAAAVGDGASRAEVERKVAGRAVRSVGQLFGRDKKTG